MLTEENFPTWREVFVAHITLRGWDKTLTRPTAVLAGDAQQAAATVEREALAPVHAKGLALMKTCIQPMWFGVIQNAKFLYEALEVLQEQHQGSMKIRKNELRDKLFSLTLGETQSIMSYMLQSRNMRAELSMLGEKYTDGAMTAALLKGLPDQYANAVEKLKTDGVEDLDVVKLVLSRKEQYLKEGEHAALVEANMKNFGISTAFLAWKKAGSPDPRKKKQGDSEARKGNLRVECHLCGKKGHMRAACPEIKCFKCGEKGHRSATCPNGGAKDQDGVLLSLAGQCVF